MNMSCSHPIILKSLAQDTIHNSLYNYYMPLSSAPHPCASITHALKDDFKVVSTSHLFADWSGKNKNTIKGPLVVPLQKPLFWVHPKIFMCYINSTQWRCIQGSKLNNPGNQDTFGMYKPWDRVKVMITH
jgi:hypothetical protein